MQYTEKDFRPIISWLKLQDRGVKKELAEFVGVNQQQISFYLKYKNLPNERFKKIKEFCK